MENRSGTLPLSEGPLGQGEGVRSIGHRFPWFPLSRFVIEKFAALSLSHDLLAQADSHPVRTRAHQIIEVSSQQAHSQRRGRSSLEPEADVDSSVRSFETELLAQAENVVADCHR